MPGRCSSRCCGPTLLKGLANPHPTKRGAMSPSLSNVEQQQPEILEVGITADVLALVLSTSQPSLDLADDACPDWNETVSPATKVSKDVCASTAIDWVPLCSTSTRAETCMSGDVDADDSDLPSFNSFYDTTMPDPQDVAHPPNKLMHEWHGQRIQRFLTGVSQRPRFFRRQVEASRQEPRQFQGRAKTATCLVALRKKLLSH
mmetsp:Transcript_25108/g.58203  ORF Transcript_25108/g.58203 Transcript_25108/m.58203 type:complete len:203 (+) Transcript_25108:3-611(+)